MNENAVSLVVYVRSLIDSCCWRRELHLRVREQHLLDTSTG